MKKILLILLILFSTLAAKAYVEEIFFEDKNTNQYPEEIRKKIDIHTVRSPLEYKKTELDRIKESLEHFKSGLPAGAEEVFTKVGFNKFSLGTGLVNVTYQVRKGVKYALKDTLAGFPEYQRRKAVEEIVNSNLASHKLTNKFLTGSSSEKTFFGNIIDSIDFSDDFDFTRDKQAPNLLKTAHKISKSELIQRLHGLFERIAYILLALLTSLAIFRRMTENAYSFSHICAEPLMNGVLSAILIALSSFLLNWTLKLTIQIQRLANLVIDEFFIKESSRSSLAESWQSFANQIGYMPSQVLAYIDTLAQCFVYFFIAGLILHIIIGVIISPIWSLAFISNSMRSSAYNSFINWSKTVLVLALIPVIYIIAKFISQEFNAYGYDFLEIVISIASYIYLPAISNIILAKSSGIFQPAFNGYQIIADSINNSYNGIKNSIETLNKT